MRVELLPLNLEFKSKRLLLAATEAGAGALLAALVRQWRPAEGSVVIASPVATPYFENLSLRVISEDMSDGEIDGLLASTMPDRVVIGASVGHSIEKRILTAAQSRGMEVDAFIDHYWNLWQRFADPDTARPWRYMPNRLHLPANICVERLVSCGAPAENVCVYDHPLLGRAATKRRTHLGCELRASLGIPKEAVVALFVSEYLFDTDPIWRWDQPHAADYVGLLSQLLNISAKSSLGRPVVVLVRPHPNEPRERWDALCNALSGSQWRNAANVSKEELLSVANLAFGLNSMLLLEAASSGLPVYSFHTQASPRDSWLSSIRSEIIELPDERSILMLFESECWLTGACE